MEGSRNGYLRGNAFVLAALTLLGAACSAHEIRGTPMHKVQMTQKGYIQFLRWQVPVPRITEFTFCLWIQSTDLALPHSIFSYSRNERERLVRSWISAGGRSVHLEIGGKQVVASPSEIRENRWYHLCLSWENRVGLYGLWIDGQLRARGRSEETVGHTIPSGGDVVLGQEYTDFDKGLEEGIEGSVLGFNLLLASAFPSSYSGAPLFARIPSRAYFPTSTESRGRRYADNSRSFSSNRTVTVPGPDDYRRLGGNSNSKRDPVGLQLVKLSYVRCEIGRGSPPIGGPLMLVSWSRTPVRVFGGATLKNVKSSCGNF